MGNTVLDSRPQPEADFERSEYEIEYGKGPMSLAGSSLPGSRWVQIGALVAAALFIGAIIGLVVSELTDEDLTSAELPSTSTTWPTVQENPGQSEALTAEAERGVGQLVVVGDEENPGVDPLSATTVPAASTTTEAAAGETTAAPGSTTAAERSTSSIATVTAPPASIVGTTRATARSTTSVATRTNQDESRPAGNRTTTTMRPQSNNTGGNSGNSGGSNSGGSNSGGHGGQGTMPENGSGGGSTGGQDHGGHGGGHGSHGGSGQWVKASAESARYPDRPIASTHYIFNPYASNAPAGWGASRIGFLVHCEPVLEAQIDPIVAPGVARSGHLHQFFGNPNVTPNSTTQSLANTPSSQIQCDDKNDKSGYWTPMAYQNGRAVPAIRFKSYYKSPRPNTVPMPFGLRMVAGNAGATKNQPRHVGWWQTTESITTADKNSMVSRGGAKNVRLRVNFPNCWDGVHLDSPDHQSHVAYAKGNKCPSSHPVAIPQVVTFTDYNASGGSGFSLASGPWYTFHQDFWNAWSPDQMEELHRRCNLAEMNCRARSGQELRPLGQKPITVGGGG